MKRTLHILLILLWVSRAIAYDNFGVGAKSASMGHAAVTNVDVWSLHNNQGAMAFFNQFSLGVFHENRFFVPENAYHAALLAVPTQYGVVGINYSFFGYKLYNDQKFGISFSKKLLERLALGVQMDAITTVISAYGNETKLCPELGLLAEPIDKFFVGAHFFNPFRNNYKYLEDKNIPSVVRLGIGYQDANVFTFNVEVEKDLEAAPVYKAGIDVNVLYGLNVRMGVYNNPSAFSFGLGYFYKKIIAGFGFVSHPVLAFTPHFSINYEFD